MTDRRLVPCVSPSIEVPQHGNNFRATVRSVAGLTDADVATAAQVVDVLERTPTLLQRQLVVCGDRVLIGRPTDRIAPFVTGG